MTDMRAIRLIVEGRVQGVGFRAFVGREAGVWGVDGFARNLRDGRVEIFAQGDPDALAMFSEACRRGPSAASVARLNVDTVEPDPATRGFTII
jgi:acylphosphatase